MPTLPEPGSSRAARVARVAGFAFVVALSVLAMSCGAIRPAPGSVPPPSSVPTPASREVVIDGATWRVLPAGTDGMRGRSDFGGADGMLFDLGRDVAPSAVAFVMDDVPIALDIAWFAADGTLVGRARLEPCVVEPCPRYEAPAPFRYAIEAPTGAFDDLPPDAALDLMT